ncbi:hypothetical protein ACLSU7_11350 [Bdellovibrio sp. HCB185ZH]|uniref:hypothetical protein n=1 Tax=Bdellovibrio sp. HCB185ZH TaxID=3394235 RepID=UPI0039A57215
MKLTTLIVIAALAISSTSYGACGPRSNNGLFKNTAATSSNIAAKAQASVKVSSTKAVR